MQTIDQLIRRPGRRRPRRPGLLGPHWTHAEVVRAQAERAAAAAVAAAARALPRGPAAWTTCPSTSSGWAEPPWPGRSWSGGNPTHRGDELARDLVPHRVPAPGHQPRLPPAGRGPRPRPGAAPRRILVVDDPTGDLGPAAAHRLRRAAGRRGRRRRSPTRPSTGVTEETLGLLLFTSGTSGAPKACLCSQGRLARIGADRGPDVRAHRRRRLLPVHAPLPLQRPDGRLGPGAGRRGHRRPAGAVQRLPVPGRRPALRGHLLQLRGQAALLHPGHPGAPRRRRQHPAPVLRQRGGRGRRGPVRRAVRLHRPGRLRVDRGRGGRPAHAGHPAGRTGPGPARHDDRRPRDRRGVPPGRLRRPGSPAQRRGGHRRDGQPDRAAPGSRGTGATPRPTRPGCATAGTGPATSPTGTRTTSSTSAAATTTGCGSTARTSPPPRSRASCSAIPTWCWPRSTPCPTPWWATRSWPPSCSATGATFDPDGLRRVPGRARRTSAPSGRPRFVRVTDELPETATTKVLKRVLRNEAWRCAEPVWWRPAKDAPYRRLAEDDADDLDRAIAER